MKKAIFLIIIVLYSLITFSQNKSNSYNKLWEDVQQLEINNLPKSALNIVETIFYIAKKENISWYSGVPTMHQGILMRAKKNMEQVKECKIWKNKIIW